MQVTVKHIFISPDHNYYGRYGKGSLDFPILERERIEVHAGKGVVDDRFYEYKEDYKGQITFFDWAVYQDVCKEITQQTFPPSAFRRNVMMEGVDLNSLIGKRFTLDGVEYTGACECSPCFWMDEACGEGTHEFLKGRGGLRARIVNDGSLCTGKHELEVLGDIEA